MTAPFLTVEGKPIQKGPKYFTVDVLTLDQNACVAHTENNTFNKLYFLSEVDATLYRTTVQLYRALNAQIVSAQEKHLGK